jgi:hypothetical protein
MGGYATLPPDWSAADAEPWVNAALAAAAALPAKQPKKGAGKKGAAKKGAAKKGAAPEKPAT